MLETAINWAGQSTTALSVLAIATSVLVIRSISESYVFFWGEFTEDDDTLA